VADERDAERLTRLQFRFFELTMCREVPIRAGEMLKDAQASVILATERLSAQTVSGRSLPPGPQPRP
jgi:hypothetical protein